MRKSTVRHGTIRSRYGALACAVPLCPFVRLCVASLFLCTTFSTAQAPSDALDLLVDHPVSVVLIPGSGSVVRFDFGDSEAEEILLQTAGPDVIFQILSSDGPQIQYGRVKTAGWMAIPLAASGHKQMLLRLSVDGALKDPGSVHVRVGRLRIPLGTLAAHTMAARLYATAQARHNSLHGEDVRQAIREYQEAAAQWARANDMYGEAIALGGEAESQAELSQYSQAIETLTRAIVLVRKNNYLHAWLAHLAARAYLDEWETRDAKRHAEESLSLSKSLNAPELAAAALADRAEAGFLTRDETAEKDAEEALSTARSSGLPEIAAFALRTEAWIEEDQGRISRAISLMAETDAFFRRSGNDRRVLETAEDLTTLRGMTGDQYAALTRHIELAPLSRDSGNVVLYGILLENIGDDYASLNRHSLASNYYQRAESSYSEVHFRSGESLILGRICLMERDSGDLTQALTDCRRSKDIALEISDQKRVAIAMYRQGLVYVRMGEADRDRKQDRLADQDNNLARDVFNKAADISHEVDDHRGEAFERIALGEVLERLKRKQEAFREFDHALRLCDGKDNSTNGTNEATDVDETDKLEALYHIARWYADGGQNEIAKEKLVPALEQIETTRKSVTDTTLQASLFAAERKCYELAIEVLMQEFQRDRASNGDALALEMSERSRARGLFDALNARTAAGNPARSATLPNLVRLNMAVDRAFDHRLNLLLGGRSKRELEANSSELTQALGTLERAEDKISASANPAGQSARTMTAGEIEGASKNSDTAYFEYALGGTQSYLWVIHRGVLTSHPLPSRDQIEDMIKKWRALVASARAPASSPPPQKGVRRNTGKNFQELSTQLSCALLGDYVQSQMKRLIIVPDGNLAMLPFAALPENACSPKPGAPVVAGHEIIVTPSLSVFLSRKAPEDESYFRGEVAIVADPVFDLGDSRAAGLKPSRLDRTSFERQSKAVGATLPRLLNSKFEAQIIQEQVEKEIGRNQAFVAVGLNASLQTVLSPAMQNYRIWHLATHGVYDETMPEFSGLVFSLVGADGSPTHGFLKAHDIANLNLRAQLVVLSACDSAAGERLNGEGVMGLSYSFLRAGARQVISTLWSVDDTVSKELMTVFYQKMTTNGNDSADALRQSQLTVMHRHHSSDPYYWAGFELSSVGN